MSTRVDDGGEVLVSDLLIRLNQALGVSRIHDTTNIAVEDAARELQRAVSDSLRAHPVVSLKADHASALLFHNDRPVKLRRHLTSTVEGLLDFFATYGVGEVRLSKNLSDLQVRALLKAAKVREEQAEPFERCANLAKRLEEAGLRGTVDIVSIEQAAVNASQKKVKVEKDVQVKIAYARTMSLLRTFLKERHEEELKTYFWSKLLHAVQGLIGLLEQAERELLALTSVKALDDADFNHAVNTCLLSLLLGRKLGLSRAVLLRVGIGGLLHGVGRFWTDARVTSKAPEERTPDEALDYARHPYRALGELLDLGRTDDALVACAVIAFTFEAGPDLPRVRRPLPIPRIAQIVGICELYDDLTTPRPGRPALSPDQAISVLVEGKRREHDPLLVQLFVNAIGLFPSGAAVQLDSGEVAVVVHANPDQPRRPVVQVVRDASGKDVDGDILDLAEAVPDRRSIVQAVDARALNLVIPEYLRG